MLLSTPFPPEEGIGNYVYNLSNKLVERGHEVIVLTRGGLKAQMLEYDKFVVFNLPFLMAYPFHVDIHGIFVNKFLNRLEEYLDIVHVHTPLTPAVSTRTPIVTTFHTPHFTDSYATGLTDIRLFLTKILGILAFRIEKSLISSSRVVSAVSKGVASDLEKSYGVKHGEVVVLGNAVSDIFLEAGRANTEQKDEAMILYIGRIEYRKGVLDLVKSMKTVTRSIPKAKLVIIGKGPLLSKVIGKVAELGLQKCVEVKGFVSRRAILETSLRASIFVVPSYYEGLPTVALEAMACQVAVIATAVRGNLEIVKHGDTGILVPPKAPKSLARAIIYLLEHPDLREELAKNARRLVERKFTWDKVADRTLTAYNTAIR
jgi:glycosyltransferase involved in cell wall biosynthesis